MTDKLAQITFEIFQRSTGNSPEKTAPTNKIKQDFIDGVANLIVNLDNFPDVPITLENIADAIVWDRYSNEDFPRPNTGTYRDIRNAIKNSPDADVYEILGAIIAAYGNNIAPPNLKNYLKIIV